MGLVLAILSSAILQYFSDCSMMSQSAPSIFAATAVVPEPPKGSRIFLAPVALIHLSGISTGKGAGCSESFSGAMSQTSVKPCIPGSRMKPGIVKRYMTS